MARGWGDVRHLVTDPGRVVLHATSGLIPWGATSRPREAAGPPRQGRRPWDLLAAACSSLVGDVIGSGCCAKTQSTSSPSAGASKRMPMGVSALVGKGHCFLEGLPSVSPQAGLGGHKETYFKTFHFKLKPLSGLNLCCYTAL